MLYQLSYKTPWTAFDGEAQVLELWGVWSTSSMPLLPSPLLDSVHSETWTHDPFFTSGKPSSSNHMLYQLSYKTPWTAFDGEAQVLELWGVWSTSSMPLLPSPLLDSVHSETWTHDPFFTSGKPSSSNHMLYQLSYKTPWSAFDGEAQVLELWGVWSTSSMPLLPSPLLDSVHSETWTHDPFFTSGKPSSSNHMLYQLSCKTPWSAFDGEAQVLELWGVWSTSSMPLLPNPLLDSVHSETWTHDPFFTLGKPSSSNQMLYQLGYKTPWSAFDGEAQVLELWGVWSSSSMPLLPNPLLDSVHSETWTHDPFFTLGKPSSSNHMLYQLSYKTPWTAEVLINSYNSLFICYWFYILIV